MSILKSDLGILHWLYPVSGQDLWFPQKDRELSSPDTSAKWLGERDPMGACCDGYGGQGREGEAGTEFRPSLSPSLCCSCLHTVQPQWASELSEMASVAKQRRGNLGLSSTSKPHALPGGTEDVLLRSPLTLPGDIQHGSRILPSVTGPLGPWHSWLRSCHAGIGGWMQAYSRSSSTTPAHP